MVDVTYPLFPIFAFLGFVVSLIPLSWHLQAWNSGTCYFMMWAALACLNQFVNSVVWAGNVLNKSPAWCEISIRITMAASVGVPASSLCINRRLYHIATARTVSLGHADKFRAILIDSLICVLFPLLFVALQYVVQGHRFDIFEDVGCYPALYNTLLTYFTSCMWPIVIGVISASYCTLSLRAFSRRRLEFSRFMNSNTSSLTMSRYFRLMALAMTDILFTTPLAILTIYLNTKVSPIGPWVSWADTHYDYGRIRQIPAILWKSNRTLFISMEFTRWVAPLCAFVFFAFFGFADEAKRNYAKAFWWAVRPFGLKPGKSLRSTKNSSSIGQFSTPKTPISAKSSYPPSSILPTYSPPPSASHFPIIDIKRPDSFTKPSTHPHESPRYSLTEKDVDSDSALGLDTPSVFGSQTHLNEPEQPRTARFNWRSLSLPFIDRRHSSYF